MGIRPHVSPFVRTATWEGCSSAAAGIVRAIMEAADAGARRAASWRLERRRPDDWGKKEQLAVTGAEGGPIRHEYVTDGELVLEALSNTQLQALGEIVLASQSWKGRDPG